MKVKRTALNILLRSFAALFVICVFALFLFGSSGASPQGKQTAYKASHNGNGHAYVELISMFALDCAVVEIPKKIVCYNAPVDEPQSGYTSTVIPVANSPPA